MIFRNGERKQGKSLLISGLYFPPQTGGISKIMAAVATALGPERVCCLTGVRNGVGALSKDFAFKVYRRRSVFRGGKVRLALGLGMTITQIMVEERGGEFFVPEIPLCVDNGAMIAWTGLLTYKAGGRTLIEASQIRQRYRCDEQEIIWR